MSRSNKFLALSILFSLSLSIFFYSLQNNSAKATNTYYTDNYDNYEASSIYADVVNSDKKTSLQEESVITTKKRTRRTSKNNKNARKVYNTIIIKTKKNENKAEKIIPIQEEIEETSVSEKRQKLNTQKNAEEKTFREEFNEKIKSIADYLAHPFRQTEPDLWYVYALGGYAVSTPFDITISSVNSSSDIGSDYMNADFNWKTGGASIISGFKVYLSQTKIAVFIGPEFFWTKLNMKTTKTSYQSYQTVSLPVTNTGTAVESGIFSDMKEFQQNVPVIMQTTPKDIIGGSLRLGLTFFNTFSVFGKANFGVLRSDIALSPDLDNITWKAPFAGSSKHQNSAMNKWKNAESTKLKNEYYGSKSSFTYGFGAGIEFSMWNEHLTFRVDYDHYWTNGTFSLYGTQYQRASSVSNTTATTGLADGESNTGIKWKAKTNFGTIRISAGISF